MLWVVSLLAALPIPLTYALRPLRENEPGGHGIVSFEFAGSVRRANEILTTWRAAGVEQMAKYVQLLDVVYPVVYAAALAGCAIAAGHALRRAGADRIAGVAPTIAWVAFAAAAFDYVENIGLDIALWYRPLDPWPLVSSVAAAVKFFCIAVTIGYALCGLAAWLKRAYAAD
jgi:sugar phosphate isomerase/epimerase